MLLVLLILNNNETQVMQQKKTTNIQKVNIFTFTFWSHLYFTDKIFLFVKVIRQDNQNKSQEIEILKQTNQQLRQVSGIIARWLVFYPR